VRCVSPVVAETDRPPTPGRPALPPRRLLVGRRRPPHRLGSLPTRGLKPRSTLLSDVTSTHSRPVTAGRRVGIYTRRPQRSFPRLTERRAQIVALPRCMPCSTVSRRRPGRRCEEPAFARFGWRVVRLSRSSRSPGASWVSIRLSGKPVLGRSRRSGSRSFHGPRGSRTGFVTRQPIPIELYAAGRGVGRAGPGPSTCVGLLGKPMLGWVHPATSVGEMHS
jgi:hypothetical protein